MDLKRSNHCKECDTIESILLKISGFGPSFRTSLTGATAVNHILWACEAEISARTRECEQLRAAITAYQKRFPCDNVSCRRFPPSDCLSDNFDEKCTPQCIDFVTPYWEFCLPWQKSEPDPRKYAKWLEDNVFGSGYTIIRPWANFEHCGGKKDHWRVVVNGEFAEGKTQGEAIRALYEKVTKDE